MNAISPNPNALPGLSTQAPAAAPAPAVSAQADVQAGATPDSAQVNLSKGLIALGNASHDVDMAKVAQIRAALANGSLNISADRIASGLLDDAAALLG